MSAILTALALATATIQSPRLGTFFSYPDWCPTSVDSAHTFGSHDFFVDETTNEVYTTHFKIFRDGVDVTDRAGQPAYLIDEWNTEQAVIDGDFVDPATERVPGGQDAVSLSWTGLSLNPDAPPPGVDYHAYSATADEQSVTPVETGRRVPRAYRLTPEMTASVYALFEAFCERCYYVNEGQSNVWDTAEYGPRSRGSDKTKFRFSLPTNGYERIPTFVYDPDTNRTVRSRRLVEYDNLYNLSGDLFASVYIDELFNIYRPSWKCSSGDVETPVRVAWSSTLFDQFEESGIPEFEWSEFPCGVSYVQWGNTALHWGNTGKYYPDRSPLYMTGTDWADQYNPPQETWTMAWHMFSGLDFGEPPFDEKASLERNYIPSTYEISNNCERLIATAFENECCVSNCMKATRRLRSDWLCGTAQILSCLDRTYYPFEPDFSAIVSNAYCTHSKNVTTPEFEIHVDRWTSELGQIVGYVDEKIELPTFEDSTNESTTVEWSSEVVPGFYNGRVSPTSTSLLLPPTVVPSLDGKDDEDPTVLVDILDLIMHVETCTYMFPDCDVYVSLPIVNTHSTVWGSAVTFYLLATAYFYTTGEETPYEYHFDLSPIASITNFVGKAVVSCSAFRSYEYGETPLYGYFASDGHPIMPGSFDRVSEASLWSISSIGVNAGSSTYPVMQYGVGYSPESRFSQTFLYRSSVDSYTSKLDMLDIVDGCSAEVRKKAHSLMNVSLGVSDFTDTDEMIKLDLSTFSRIGRGMNIVGEVARATAHSEGLDAGSEPSVGDLLMLHFVVEGEVVTEVYGSYWTGEYPDYEEWRQIDDLSQPIVTIAVSTSANVSYDDEDDHSLDVTEHYGAAAEGHAKFMSRVDWNWNCLRRSDNN